ncbi:MAG: hypothetical protein Q4G69_03360 [Planctomycetia bacterium]|nr:hypothetical protein [Planctomycetia bacterium]
MELMRIEYTLTCECGKTYPVNVSLAGQEIDCSCGKKIIIPTMIKMKKLPLWEEPEAASVSPVPQKTVKKGKLHGGRLGLFIIGLIIALLSGWFLYSLLKFPPNPVQVFSKRIMYASGEKYVHRNSSPVSQEDYEFYLFHDPYRNLDYVIEDGLIDAWAPFPAYTYFDSVRNGLTMSDNFYDNFEEIKYQHRIMVAVAIIVIVIGLVLAVLPWIIPEKKTVVGTMRGTEWKV